MTGLSDEDIEKLIARRKRVQRNALVLCILSGVFAVAALMALIMEVMK